MVREIGMAAQKFSFGHEIALSAPGTKPYGMSRPSDTIRSGSGAGWSEPRTNLIFAAKLLRCLRGGSVPPAGALECSGFVEHWTVIADDDVCLLTGVVWRLPLSRHTLTTPLLAIDPTAGWARAIGEWLTIGAPCVDLAAAGMHPDGVAERAARWLERQLQPAGGNSHAAAENA
jgi:hypothetical protein